MNRKSKLLRSAVSAFAVLFIVAFSVVLSACEKEKTEPSSPKELVLSAAPLSFEAGGSTTFTVLADGEDVTSEAVVVETTTDTEVTGATWSSDTDGTYTFEATYQGVKSNVVTVAVDPVGLSTAKVGISIAGSGETVTRIAIRGIIEDGAEAPDMTEYEFGLTNPSGITATSTPENVTAEDGYLELAPQTLTEYARIIVTANGKKVGFQVENIAEFKADEEYVISVTIPELLPLDYTDNAMSAFVIAPTDIVENENILWADAMADCPEGYRLPTYNEGLAILLYANAAENNKFRGASYWTSTLLKMDDTQAMGYDILRMYALYMPTAGITAGRCVASTPAGKKYPYIDTTSPDGPVIVSRDADGGVIPSSFQEAYNTDMPVFHDNWDVTPEHDATTLADKISRKLQVANTDAEIDKVIRDEMVCADGWRTPTQYELMLIYAVGGAEATSYDVNPESSFYNPPVVETALNSVAGFTPFQAEGYWAETILAGKGVMPLTWPFTETPISGGGSFAGPDTNWVRCVRDVRDVE